MPQLNPGEERVAIATFPTKPAGLACTAELWLASDMTKVATSGGIPFTATGEDQPISLPITMPAVEGIYPVYLAVLSNGLLISAYRADEDVVIEVVPPEELVVPGWIVDDKVSMQAWWPLKEPITWTNIFREEYITYVLGNVPLDDPITQEEGFDVGYTWTVEISPIRYEVWTVTGYDPSLGIWLCNIEKHWRGLDSVEGREYWKTQIPTGVPVSFAFYQSVVTEDAFRELESAGAADVTNIFWIVWSVNWPLCFRAIIYDLDGFFNILRKYQWLNMAGKIVE